MTKFINAMVNAAAAGLLCFATMTASAAESRSPTTMKPLSAASLDVGSKHIVGYFLKADGQCRLTLMIADALRDDDREPSAQILRLRLLVEPGKSALVDATGGRLVQYGCEQNADAMSATLLDQVAVSRDGK